VNDPTRTAGPPPVSGPPDATTTSDAAAADPIGTATTDLAAPASSRGFPAVAGYEILGELGRGGMGVVYQARHLALNRLVAIKLVPAEAPTSRLVRFHQEAEAVAKLQHPNIVQVFEFGVTDGCPFLALEFVDGGTLKDKVAGVPQPPRDAARLVETVARAVHHAHEMRVVHRDLKPSNVLLTAGGVPKVTDFGLARFLDAGLGLTQTQDYVGTPAYSAPEQVLNRTADIGPATDTYALGVSLYELLTGRVPFASGSTPEILRAVAEQEPVTVRRLVPNCPRDLETVCLKCLQKDPRKRYRSADELADDLHRFLADEPIAARPVGRLERLGRWARRHPSMAGLLTAVFGLLTLVAVGAVIAAVRIDDARRRADENAAAAQDAAAREAKAKEDALRAAKAADDARRKAADEADRATREASAAEEAYGFLAGLYEPQDRLSLGSVSLGFRANQGDALKANDLLARGVRRLNSDAGLRNQPLVRARLLHQIGTIYLGLGELPAARPLLAEALALRRAHLPPTHPDLGRTLTAVAHVGFLVEEEPAADQFREAVRIFRGIDPAGLELAEAETGLALCGILWDVPIEEQIALLEHGAEVRRARLGDDDFRTITTDVLLAIVYLKNPGPGTRARFEKGLELAVRTVARLEQSNADPELKRAARLAVRTFQAYAVLGARAAIGPGRDAVRQVTAVFGPGHFLTLAANAEFAALLYEALPSRDPGLEEAVLLLGANLVVLEAWGGPPPCRTGEAHLNLGRTLNKLGRHADAEPHLRAAVGLFRPARPAQAENLPHALQALSLCLVWQNRPDEVPGLLKEALDVCWKNPRVPRYRLAHQLMDYGRIRLDAGDAATAAPLFAEAAEVRRQALGADHVEVGEALAFRYEALKRQGKDDEAAGVRKELEPFMPRINRGDDAVARRARLALDGKPPRWGTAP
jgi:hypothetical protein